MGSRIITSDDKQYYKIFARQTQMIRVNDRKDGLMSNKKEGWDKEIQDSSKHKERAYNLKL